MAGRFSYSSPESRHGGMPWFKVGDVPVGTTLLVSALCVLSMFVWAANPAALEPLLLVPGEIRSGEVWRLATWPLANPPDFWTVITIAIFWYFGREIEGMLGRNRFAWFLGILTVVPALFAAVLDLQLFERGGLRYVELGVFIVFIAEFPTARFFFNIPGWVIGAVIVGIQLLQFLGVRAFDSIVFLLVVLATAGLAARSFGLATQLPWIPKLPMPGTGESSGRSPKRRGSGRTTTKARSRQTVVDGPWGAPAPQRPSAETAAAQAELDRLLDKISAGGLDSLDSAEKKRLNELSKRLR